MIIVVSEIEINILCHSGLYLIYLLYILSEWEKKPVFTELKLNNKVSFEIALHWKESMHRKLHSISSLSGALDLK